MAKTLDRSWHPVSRLCRAAAKAAGLAALLLNPVAALAQPAVAPPLPETPAAFGEVLRRFASEHKLSQATITVRKGGQRVYASETGGARPDAVHNVASLSKAITGACIGTLIRDGMLTIDTPLGVAAPALLKAVPAIADERIRAMTIAQLLTHTAGLAGNNNDGEKSTGSGSPLFDRANVGAASAVVARKIAIAALGQPLKYAPGTFRYSNDGYAILGRVIEEKTGKPYGAACTERVVAAAGAKGDLSGVTAAMDSYGGWRFSGNDYLTVLERITRDATIIGPAMMAWKSSAQAYNGRGNGVWYGPGLLIRRYANNFNQFHWGSWRAWHLTANGRVDYSFNAFAVRAGFLDLSYFVYFEPQIPEDKRSLLDKRLWEAVTAVKTWVP